jgi:N-glycosylase/DNA lyase
VRLPDYPPQASYTRITLDVPAGFRLDAAVRSHGWYDLPPFARDDDGSLAFVTEIDGQALALRVRESAANDGSSQALAIDIRSASPLDEVTLAAIRAVVAEVLMLDVDLGPFHDLVDGHPEFTWVRAAGAGRLLRAPTVFEDLVKMICTTNCTWDATRRMVSGLVEHLGPLAPDGSRGFPGPARMAAEPESFYRDVVRAGYRARALRELAERAAREPEALSRLRQVNWPSADLRRALLALHGIGPYAAENMLRLLARHDYLAIDSWCRNVLTRRNGGRRTPSDARIARNYARFGPYQGLALWLDLTRDWPCYADWRTSAGME